MRVPELLQLKNGFGRFSIVLILLYPELALRGGGQDEAEGKRDGKQDLLIWRHGRFFASLSESKSKAEEVPPDSVLVVLLRLLCPGSRGFFSEVSAFPFIDLGHCGMDQNEMLFFPDCFDPFLLGSFVSPLRS
jgi:hypothetical protein